MEESPSNDVDLDEQEETASIASTIDTEYNSDEEWITSGILADCEIDGETRYLLEWEGFPLFDASWEPRSNLNQKLIDDWELAKKEEGAQRKANNKIWAWRKASMERLQGKLARHEERNRKRRERGLKETSYGENLEDHLAYLGQFPEGEEPEPDAAEASSPTNSALDQQDNTKTSAQAGSPAELNRKPSIAKQDDDDNHSPRSRHRSSPSTHGESSRQAGPPASSATNKDPPRRQSSSDHKGLDVSRKQAPRTSGSLLVNKFGHLKPPQRVTSNISNNQLAVRKTKTPQTLSSNVFVGGTKRKQRPTLLDAVNDLSKGQKVLRPRFARIVQKGQRDREGAVAPAKKPSSLFSLNPADKGAAVRQHPPDVVSSSSTAEAEGMSGLLSHDKAVEHEKNSSTNNQEPAKPKKPKKSVGWGTIEEATIPLVDEPMELDDEESLFVSDHVPISVKRDIGELEEESTVPFPSRPNPPSRRVHWPEEPFIEDDGVRSEAQSLTKDVQFGPKSAVITVTLEQLPQQHGRPWLPTLEKEEKLVFTHTCMMEEFRDLSNTIISDKPLGHGTITARNNAARLAAVSNWLWLRSVGVLFHRPELCVLIHTMESMSGQKENDAVTTDGCPPTLRYTLFRPGPALPGSSLAPVSMPGGISSGDVMPSMGETVAHGVFGFHYDRLLPERMASSTEGQNFFLAFPQSVGEDAQFTALLLRSCRPGCKIMSSLFPGHWRSFLQLDQGVAIIHEDAIWTARLFPDFHFLLHSQPTKFQVWVFSKSLQQSVMYCPPDKRLPRMGDVRFQQICQSRSAILVTPSFAVSQPRQLWSLFKWIRNSWDSDRMATRLVICAGFDKWLLDLAADKSTRPSNRMRLDKEGIEALYKAWHRTRELIDRSTEENTAFIFAPESIDANDEQSLVNWFGWWSIMNMDQFRRFNVLGSSETDPRKLAFRIHRPKYTISTFGNPDEVVAMLDREESKNHQGPDQPATEPLGRAQLQLVPGDDAHALTTFLQTVDSKNKASKWTPQIVYKFPVSYWNSGMAWDFGDYQNSFGTYNKLLRFAFDHVNKSSNYNTTMAFCYTIEGGWDPNGRPGAMDKTRRPWIMIYRAVEPHYKPWKAAELFIWDAARRHPVGEGQQVYEGDLIEAQRQLIHAIHEQDDAGAARGLPLTKVWVGGLDGRPTALTEPIDITLHYLQRFVENIKICLPAPADKLPARGWTLVKRGNAPATSRPPSTESMDIDVPEAEPNTDNACLKMVFHPPRGKQIMRPTECKNRLYQHTQVEIARSQHQQSMEFKFRPTMEWYRQQVEEGRGFEHIRVTTWDAICEMYKIEDTEQGLRR
ncbi:hypothetical protein ACJZ2D_002215 [Fusarium nematophilum]